MTEPETPHHAGFVWMICVVAAMGGLLFGYDWVVIGGAKPFYEQAFGIAGNASAQGFAMSTALLGCLVGAAVSGKLTERFGRKWLLVFSALLFSVSAVLTAIAADLTMFNVARWIGGVGIGLASNLSPMYISEVSPAAMRGRLVAVNQLTLVIGILAAQLVNWAIASGVPSGTQGPALLDTWCGEYGWRWMFAAETFPAALFFGLMFLAPESPRWLAKAGRTEEAEAILARIGGRAHAADELAAIRATLGDGPVGRERLADLFDGTVSRVLVIGVALVVLQQWCGINVIFNYAEEVFTAAGYDVRGTMAVIVATGVVNLLFTLVGMSLVDRIGRRSLMLFGASGLALLFLTLGGLYYAQSTGAHMAALVLAGIAVYAMSLAPVTWVVISEIFPNRVRGSAMALCVLALWTACAALTFTFPMIKENFGAAGAFWLYAGISLLGFVFIWFELPETKDKSLEEIEAELAPAAGPGPRIAHGSTQ
ncbi:D-xylose-proton symporter [Pirellulimonas nuda]|uniref:D-xylose-proton symporter n=1 Tax=Pirellulimonas nuda TaxID=2528009 RepID=A0A518DBJ7_9BACT|nr:sugar porter family MFS transporter [Pirellulimonas nuda]QDU88833.1 D-xylose-proton symporter [Pirellulimonas nuda]